VDDDIPENPNNDPNTDRNGLDGIDSPTDQFGNPCIQSGHGTAMASIIGGADYGVAKNVTIHAVRVVRCNRTWNVNEAIAGIDQVTSDSGTRPGIKIANMSIGYDDSFSQDPGWTLDGHADDETALDRAVRGSMMGGVVYVCAAGNGDTSGTAVDVDAFHVSPARVKDVLTVSGTTFTQTFRDIKITSGNFGPKVDLFAPGANTPSAGNHSNTEQVFKNGTSVSAAIVSGIAALYAQRFPPPNWQNYNFGPQNRWEETINLLIKSNVNLGAINLTNGAPTTTTYNRLTYMAAIPPDRTNPINDTGYFVWRQYLDFYGCSQVPSQPGTDLYDTVYVEPDDTGLQSKPIKFRPAVLTQRASVTKELL
jgi:subtilisin family serine protease